MNHIMYDFKLVESPWDGTKQRLKREKIEYSQIMNLDVQHFKGLIKIACSTQFQPFNLIWRFPLE